MSTRGTASEPVVRCRPKAVPPMLCHSWLLDRSYILCDADSFGFPIRYVSSAFAEMFDTSPLACLQKKCGALMGIESIRTSDPFLAAFTTASGLNPLDARKALDVLQAVAEREVMQMLALGTGSFVAINRTLTGKLIVVSVVMHIVTHPASGRRYALGLQCEITNSVTVEEACSEALRGGVFAIEENQSFLNNCQDVLKKQEVLEFLHRTMEATWEADAQNTCRALQDQSQLRLQLSPATSPATTPNVQQGSPNRDAVAVAGPTSPHPARPPRRVPSKTECFSPDSTKASTDWLNGGARRASSGTNGTNVLAMFRTRTI